MCADNRKSKAEFGPVFSKLYSIFSSILPSSRKFYEMIAEDVGSYDGSKILDVGCGPGNLISAIARRSPGARLFGTDPSPGMVRAAKKRTSKISGRHEINIMEGDCLNVPFSEKFNIIVTSSSYHHWDAKEECLQNLFGMLEPSGTLTIYERYSGESHRPKSSGETHSLSYREAETLSIGSARKKIRVIGPLIAVRFFSEPDMEPPGHQ